MQRKRIRKSGVQYFCTPLLAGAIFVWHQNRYKDDDEGEKKMYRNIGEGEVIAVGYFSKLQKKRQIKPVSVMIRVSRTDLRQAFCANTAAAICPIS